MPSRWSCITPNTSKIAANAGSVGGEGEATAWSRAPAWAKKSSWTRVVIGVAARPAMAKSVVSVAWRFAPRGGESSTPGPLGGEGSVRRDGECPGIVGEVTPWGE